MLQYNERQHGIINAKENFPSTHKMIISMSIILNLREKEKKDVEQTLYVKSNMSAQQCQVMMMPLCRHQTRQIMKRHQMQSSCMSNDETSLQEQNFSSNMPSNNNTSADASNVSDTSLHLLIKHQISLMIATVILHFKLILLPTPTHH